MTSWKENPLVQFVAFGFTVSLSDHNRSPLSEEVERIENKSRMADGTMRRYSVARKRTWSMSWDLLPSTNRISGGMSTADGGMAGETMEAFCAEVVGPFRMILRRGSARGLTVPEVADSALPYDDNNFYIVNVMVSDFSKEVVKRGPVDLWNVSMTLEEV